MSAEPDDAVLRIAPLPDGGVCLHGTAVAVDGKALLICGPPGAGKSGLAAEILVLGGTFVADDLTCLHADPDGPSLLASAPSNAPGLLELRGLGLCAPPRAMRRPLAMILILAEQDIRLPAPEEIEILGRAVPLLRHPRTPGAAAKLVLWLRFGQPIA